MREKLQIYVCLQLSLLVHYGLLTCIAAEVQAQSIRANKHSLIKAMNIARRAGLNVARYQNMLNHAPLTSEYEDKIEFGSVIQKQLQEMSSELNGAIEQVDDWTAYHKRLDSVLVVDTTNPQLVDSWAFIDRKGSVEWHCERYLAGDGQIVDQSSRTDHLSASTVEPFFSMEKSIPPRRPVMTGAQAGEKAGTICVDYQNVVLTDLLSSGEGPQQYLLLCYRQLKPGK